MSDERYEAHAAREAVAKERDALQAENAKLRAEVERLNRDAQKDEEACQIQDENRRQCDERQRSLELQVDGLRKALEQIATAKSLPSPITGDSYRLDNILQSIARKALEGCAQKPVEPACLCAGGFKAATVHKKECPLRG